MWVNNKRVPGLISAVNTFIFCFYKTHKILECIPRTAIFKKLHLPIVCPLWALSSCSIKPQFNLTKQKNITLSIFPFLKT